MNTNFFRQIRLEHVKLGCLTPKLAISSTSALPDLTRDHRIKYEISRRYHFVGETLILELKGNLKNVVMEGITNFRLYYQFIGKRPLLCTTQKYSTSRTNPILSKK
jgi:hypothetical protein